MRLAKHLENHGLKTWVDDVQNPDSLSFSKREQALQQCTVLILCMSPAAFGVEWGRLERSTEQFRNPRQIGKRFVPVLFEDCSIRATIRGYKYFDWRDESENKLTAICSACRPQRLEGTDGRTRTLSIESAGVWPGHQAWVSQILTSSDSRRAITASDDGTVREWNIEQSSLSNNLTRHEPLLLNDHGQPIKLIALSPCDTTLIAITNDDTIISLNIPTSTKRQWQHNGQKITALAIFNGKRRFITGHIDGSICIWDLQKLTKLKSIPSNRDEITSIAIAIDSKIVATGSRDGTIQIWDVSKEALVSELIGHARSVSSVSLSQNSSDLISASNDGTVRIWKVKKALCAAVFEGHPPNVSAAYLSPANDFLLSVASDGIRGWSTPLGLQEFYAPADVGSSALTPDGTHLVCATPACHLLLWRIDTVKSAATNRTKIENETSIYTSPECIQYTNAKVVLLGESGAGKSALANRLLYDRYDKTDSSHGLTAKQIPISLESADGIQKEIWLWDLAGQEDYRIIHQLYLHETTVALFVADPQLDDPLMPLEKWLRALNSAAKQRSSAPANILVSSRIDRGDFRISKDRVDDFVTKMGFAGQIATSARLGTNCSDSQNGGNPSQLKQLIVESINWADCPKISTTALITTLKRTLVDRGGVSSRKLVRFSEIAQWLDVSKLQINADPKEIRSGLSLLDNQGLLKVLDFGDLVLLDPSVFYNYAAAIIRAARSGKDQIGVLQEGDLLLGKIDFDGVARLDLVDESLLLRAILQVFLSGALCLATDAEGGRHLVFPAHFRSERSQSDLPFAFYSFQFDGEIATIYSTLVVRLCHSQVFMKESIWSNSAEFRSVSGSLMGFWIERNSKDGSLTLRVYSKPETSIDQKALLVQFVGRHLNRYASNIVRRRSFVCQDSRCGKPVLDESAINMRLRMGKRDIVCSYCDGKVPLVDLLDKILESPESGSQLADIDARIGDALDSQAKEQVLIGHMLSICGEANQIFRPATFFDMGIDGEIEFKTRDGRASGKRIYVQLKSGDSFLRTRKVDRQPIFDVKSKRHLQYWAEQPCDVWLVIRDSGGQIQWMNLTVYLSARSDKESLQIEFCGEQLDAFALLSLRDRMGA